MFPALLYPSAPLADRFHAAGLARALLQRIYVLHSLEDIQSATYQPALPVYQHIWRAYILQFRTGVHAGTELTPPLSPRSVFERERARTLAATLTQLTQVDHYLFSAWRDYTAWRVVSA